jgi:prepilin-type processing-associated H-X9-DG protein
MDDWDEYLPGTDDLPQWGSVTRHLSGNSDSGLDYFLQGTYFHNSNTQGQGKGSILDCPSARFEMPCTDGTFFKQYDYGFDPIPEPGYTLQTTTLKPLAVMSVSPSLQAMVFCGGTGDPYMSRWWIISENRNLLTHSGGNNILYWDGHVGWLAYENLPADGPFWNQ